MRVTSPRIAPVPEHRWTSEQKALAGPISERGMMSNIFRTLLAHPEAMRGFMAWGSYVFSERNTLPAREREIVILRTGYLCRSGYEWAQHVAEGLHAGLTPAEIEALKEGADAPCWSASDAALIRAADELHRDQFIADATWSELSAAFDVRQCMDVVFTAGQYIQVSMLLNTFGVQLEAGRTLDHDLKP